MSDSKRIEWDEVEHGASMMFSVWLGSRELDWAKEAWGHLSPAGLTRRDTLIEETAAKLRLVTLKLEGYFRSKSTAR